MFEKRGKLGQSGDSGLYTMKVVALFYPLLAV
jgi:hypothetical protein